MPEDLNTPEIRRDLIAARLETTKSLSANSLAEEFDVSGDTIRRDLIALEKQGLIRRTRGGGIPLLRPVRPFSERKQSPEEGIDALARRAVGLVPEHAALFMDGGTTMLAIAHHLSAVPPDLVVTPAPAIALAVQAAGIRVHLIGGRLSASGGLAVGAATERAIAEHAVDICFLGVCGLDAAFGLSADEADEASVKSAMSGAAQRTYLVTTGAKIGKRARHRVLPISALDGVICDGDPHLTEEIARAGVQVHHV